MIRPRAMFKELAGAITVTVVYLGEHTTCQSLQILAMLPVFHPYMKRNLIPSFPSH